MFTLGTAGTRFGRCAESIELIRASSAISGRRLRAQFGHAVVDAEAESAAYGICGQCGDLQSVISTVAQPYSHL